MNLWRLEWLRLVRTRRLVALFGVFVFFGLAAAPMTKYLPQILEATSGDQVQITLPPQRPVDGIASFTGNAAQLGLLVFVLVTASALTVDAHREIAVFLRTRVRRSTDLVVPRYAVSVAAGSAALVTGVALAWAGTGVLLGGVDAVGIVAGTLAWVLYLAFLGAVTAVCAARLSSVVATAALSIGVALVLAALGTVEVVGRWLPSRLVGALTALAGGGSLADLWPSALVTVVATVALVALAVRLAGRREL